MSSVEWPLKVAVSPGCESSCYMGNSGSHLTPLAPYTQWVVIGSEGAETCKKIPNSGNCPFTAKENTLYVFGYR
jgi:hypothetical protein